MENGDMKKAICFALLITTASLITTEAADKTSIAEIFGHYEAIRQVLIEDSTDGVAEQAAAIRRIAERLHADFNAERAGVGAEDAAAVRDLLPEVVDGAAKVAAAADLETIRLELAELTKPLVRWHALVQGERPVVVYCPMEKKAWLQPDEAIGNPYAPYMLRCGDVVQR
jgi:hypothetical protein